MHQAQLKEDPMKGPTLRSDAKRLIQENQQLKELLEAARLVFSTLELKTAIKAILKSTQELTHATQTSIALFDEDTGELGLCAHRGFNEDFIGTIRWKPRRGSPIHTLLHQQETLIIKQTPPSWFFKEDPLEKHKAITLACIPLVFEKKVLGVLFANDARHHGFSSQEKRALTVLASFAATAIDRVKLHQLTKELTRIDGLTGLYNYRYFHERLDEELQRAKRYNRPLSVIMLDVDDFKRINDSFGHHQGDLVLKGIAGIVRQSMRDVDMASRYGGEEFTVMLPETDTHHSLVVAERIRRNVEKRTPGLLGAPMQKGARISLGIACFPHDADEKDDLIQRADEAMYIAKAKGKNRVISSSP